MLGFYPVTPGIPMYDIGSPIFDKATIHLKDGKQFEILALNNSHDNKYVQKIVLNGRSLNQVWFRHSDIESGGTLELTMGDSPDTSLGSSSSTTPPASIDTLPDSFADHNQ
jgi:putative alpha-1,2-mannosidase